MFFDKDNLFFLLLFIFFSFFVIFFFNNCFVEEKIFLEEDYSLKVFFCPEDFCSNRLIQGIDSANESVFVAIYSFTHKDIANSLISAKNRGVEVIVVLDFLQSTSTHSVLSFLEENNVPVFIKKGSGAMHNKFSIIDGEKVFTGSFNYSLNADLRNDENLIFIQNKEIASKFLKKFNFLVMETN